MLVWKVNNPSVSIASFRYRCVLPLRYLQKYKIQSVICGGAETVFLANKSIQAIIFVKSFKERDLKLARKAYKSGIPIILDLCDNIFIKEYGSDLSDDCPAFFFKEMAQLSSAIVTTGLPLKNIIENEIKAPIPVVIIPDSNESLDDIDFAYNFIAQNNWAKVVKYSPVSISVFYIKKLLSFFRFENLKETFGQGKPRVRNVLFKRRSRFIKIFKQWCLKVQNLTLTKLRSKLRYFFYKCFLILRDRVLELQAKNQRFLKKLKGFFVKSRSRIRKFLKQGGWKLKGFFVKFRSQVRRLLKQALSVWKMSIAKIKYYVKLSLNCFGLWEFKNGTISSNKAKQKANHLPTANNQVELKSLTSANSKETIAKSLSSFEVRSTQTWNSINSSVKDTAELFSSELSAKYAECPRGMVSSTSSHPTHSEDFFATQLPKVSFPKKRSEEAIYSKSKEPVVLWFGNHGAKYGKFGMLNILKLSEVLEELYKELKFKLLVVSNNYQKYLDNIAVLNISSSYLEWHPTQIYDYISASDVVIIPNSKTNFSICKSANRAVLALSLNVPVVATKTPALELFESCIIFDDWEYGLRSYLSNKSIAREHVQKAQAVIQENYSGPIIAHQWINLLEQVKR